MAHIFQSDVCAPYFYKEKKMKYFAHKFTTLLFVVLSMGFLTSFSGCDELIEKAKQLIPDAGSQFNAAEEMRGAQGKSDKTLPYAPKGVSTPNTACKGCYYVCSWSSTPNATHYCVNWSLHKNGSKTKEGTSNWIDKLEYGWTIPNEIGIVYVNVYAKNSGGQSREPLSFAVTVKDGKNGQLIFLTHGLNDNVECFKETVNSLKKNDNYFDLGYVTMRKSGNYLNTNKGLKQIIDEKIFQGINVLVRTEFSAGNLSFEKQLEEMKQMVAKFEGHNANVIFIGHSMGGLASINYGMYYTTGKNLNKKVKIITVDTPYQPNNYARTVWGGKDEKQQLISEFSEWSGKQTRGYAHRDLGGFGTAFSDLRIMWNDYYRGSAKLYAISVSINNDWRWEKVGDGIVDIPSQQGNFLENQDVVVGKWNRIDTLKTIFGKGGGSGFYSTKNSYFHSNTPALPEVIAQIKGIIEK